MGFDESYKLIQINNDKEIKFYFSLVKKFEGVGLQLTRGNTEKPLIFLKVKNNMVLPGELMELVEIIN